MKCVITVSGQKIPFVSKVLLQIFYCNILKYRCLYIELNFSIVLYHQRKGLPRWCSSKKNPPASSGESGPIPGSGRSPGVGNGNPL